MLVPTSSRFSSHFPQDTRSGVCDAPGSKEELNPEKLLNRGEAGSLSGAGSQMGGVRGAFGGSCGAWRVGITASNPLSTGAQSLCACFLLGAICLNFTQQCGRLANGAAQQLITNYIRGTCPCRVETLDSLVQAGRGPTSRGWESWPRRPSCCETPVTPTRNPCPWPQSAGHTHSVLQGQLGPLPLAVAVFRPK